jgi:DNA-binding response OmpR family regulator
VSVHEISTLAGTVILGIDDQEDNLLFLRSVLETRKVTFFGTTNSTECFGLAGRVQPRVVLLDIQMPGMDGFETCRRLRTMREVQDTPIIFLTGRKTVEDVKCGLAAGGNDFIAKPFDPEKLLSRVEYWANRGVRGSR